MGFIQSAHQERGSGSWTTGVATLGSPVVVGNRLLVAVYVYGSGITLGSTADNLGNQGSAAGVYDQVLGRADAFNGHLYLVTVPITVAGSCTVTATVSGGNASFVSIWVGEYSGLVASVGVGSDVVDVTASNGGTLNSTSLASGTTAATAGAGELAFAVIGNTAEGGFGFTSPGGWAERFNSTPGNYLPLVVDDQTPAGGAAVSATWTAPSTDTNNGFAAFVAVFKTVAAALIYQAPTPPLLSQFPALGTAALYRLYSPPQAPAIGPIAYTRTVVESVGAGSDSLSRVFTGARSASESVGAAADTLTRQLAAGRTVAESVGAATDTLSRAQSAGRTVSESVSSADTPARQVTASRTVSESGTSADTLTRQMAAGRSVAEAPATATDTLTRQVVTARTATEAVGAATDAPTRQVVAARTLTEAPASASDTPTRVLTAGRSTAESVGPAADAVSRQAAFDRAPAESVGPAADTVTGVKNSGQHDYVRTVTEAVGAAVDVLSRGVTALRSLVESVGPAADVLSWVKGRVANPASVGAYDQPAGTVGAYDWLAGTTRGGMSSTAGALGGNYVAGSKITVATYTGAIGSPTDGFRDRTGALVDPQIAELRYRTPDGTTATVIYPSAPIVRDAAGLYHADLDTTGKPGLWVYEWLAPSGDQAQAIAAKSFYVIPAPVPV